MENQDVEILSRCISPYELYCSDRAHRGNACVTRYNNVTVFGYDPYRFLGSIGKLHQIRSLLKEAGAPVLVEPEDSYGVNRLSAWARSDGKRAAVLLINTSLDPIKNTDLVIRGEMKKAVFLSVDKPEQPACCSLADDAVRVRIPEMGAWEMLLLLAE